MPLNSTHPFYAKYKPDWQVLRDCFAGERWIKEASTTYLPATQGMEIDGMNTASEGYKAYQAYKMRARYTNYIKQAVVNMVGTMCSKPAKIEVPKSIESMIARATRQNESLELLLRRIFSEQIWVGRIGLLLDVPTTIPGAAIPEVPFIATYNAETILNWDSGTTQTPIPSALNLVVLDESGPERGDDFEWLPNVEKYRVLVLGEIEENEAAGDYRTALFKDTTAFNEGELMEPEMRGRKLQVIPFQPINAADLLPEPNTPPLIELAELSLSMYRSSADHEQNLFMQGQDTLCVIGASRNPKGEYPTWRTGAGASINLGKEGDAKFIGVGADGLDGQIEAYRDKEKQAKSLSMQMLDTTSRQKESGDALNTRVAAQTVTLREIAITGAEGLRQILIYACMWGGMTREAADKAVKVTPNLSFAESTLTPAEFVQIQSAKTSGLVISDESIHNELVAAELTDKTFEEEKAAVDQERQDAQKLATQQADQMGAITLKHDPRVAIAKARPPKGNKKNGPSNPDK